MGDKEIIIDGIDVSKCRFKSLCNLGTQYFCNLAYEEQGRYGHWKHCFDCPNCEFKQLQRAKEKCNNPIFLDKKDAITLCKMLINKTLNFWEENEKLKGKLELYQKQINKIERIATCIKEDRYDVGYADILDKINYIKTFE